MGIDSIVSSIAQQPSNATREVANSGGRSFAVLRSVSPLVALLTLVAAVVLFKLGQYIIPKATRYFSEKTEKFIEKEVFKQLRSKQIEVFKALLNTKTLFLNHFEIIRNLASDNKFEEAFQALKVLSDQGDLDALFWMSSMYLAGIGVEESLGKAIEYFQLASDKGHMEASRELAYLYFEGIEVTRSHEKALKYCQRSDQNDDEIQFIQGHIWHVGEGTPKSIEEAIIHYQKASDLGNAEASYTLAMLYFKGKEIEKSPEKTFSFLNKTVAAAPNHQLANYFLAEIYYVGEGVDQSFESAYKLYIKALPLNYARYNLAVCQYNGEGTEQSFNEAYKNFEIAAKELPRAFARLGDMHLYGHHVEKSEKKAKELYLETASKLDTEELYELGRHYAAGETYKQNDIAAAIFFSEAVFKEHPPAMYSLALLYESGRGVEASFAKALELHRQAAEWGHVEAQYRVGIFLHSENKHDEALHYLKKAAENNNQNAKDYIAQHFAQHAQDLILQDVDTELSNIDIPD